MCLSDPRDTSDEDMWSVDLLDDGGGVSDGSAFSGRRGYGKTTGASLPVVPCRQGRKYTGWVYIQAGGIRKELAACPLSRAWYSTRSVLDGGNPDISASCKAQSQHWWLTSVVCTPLQEMKWRRWRDFQWPGHVPRRCIVRPSSDLVLGLAILAIVVGYRSPAAPSCTSLWPLSNVPSHAAVGYFDGCDRLLDTHRRRRFPLCWRWIAFCLWTTFSAIEASDVEASPRNDDRPRLVGRQWVSSAVVDRSCDSSHWQLASTRFVALIRGRRLECRAYTLRRSSSGRRWSCDVAGPGSVAIRWWSLHTC